LSRANCANKFRYLRRCAFENLTVYCDESGNSGSNYIDVQQPIFVLAGWAVRPQARVRIEQAVADLGRRIGTPEREIHCPNLFTSEGRCEAVRAFFDSVGQSGAIPFVSIAEKRFCLGAKIVETFLDSAFNSRVTNAFGWDLDEKQNLAAFFSTNLPRHVLADFARAYRLKSAGALIAALGRIRTCVALLGRPGLAWALDGSAESILDGSHSDGNGPLGLDAAWESLNLPVFASFCSMLESFGRDCEHDISLVHDETKEFEAGFRRVLDLYSSGPPRE
jgi:hypothetical protein